MITVKKISAIEYRASNRFFFNDFAPLNFFEKMRYEIIINQVFF